MGTSMEGTGLTLWVGPVDRMEAALAERRGRVLMAVRYGGPAAGLHDAGQPLIDVPNPVLGDAPRVEVWSTSARADSFRRGDMAWAEDDRALFGRHVRRVGDDIEKITFETYRDMLAVLDERGYPCLQRVWNYVPRINDDQRGVERYKRFNVGRGRAFEERFGSDAGRHFSAASAVGTLGDSLVVCFAAGRKTGTHLENPRQVSPPHYPVDYGPKSPCFARGTFAPSDWGGAFFLSGTASVVGHATMHAGDPLRQLEETVTNVEALLGDPADRRRRGRPGTVRFDLLKIYLRHKEHLPAIREALTKRLDASTPMIYLMADLCRSDLLLEIEGVSLSHAP